MAQFPLIPTTDLADLGADVRQLLAELIADLGTATRVYTGECRPSADVVEGDDQVEVIVDLPGVPPAAVRVAFRSGVLLIVGEKPPAACGPTPAYHLLEREFGRFARAVPVSGAVNLQAARATLRDGELSIILPRLDERRGRLHCIPVQTGPDSAS